jgi:hypothetical protein
VVTEENIKGLSSWTLPSGTLGLGTPDAVGRWGDAFIVQQ